MQIPLRDVKVGEEFKTGCGTKLMKGNVIQESPPKSSVIYLESYGALRKGDISTDWSEDELVEVDRPLTFAYIQDGEEFTYMGDTWIKVKSRPYYNAIELRKSSSSLVVGLFTSQISVQKSDYEGI